MKELSIEQKAKAYDEALERTKQIIMDYDYDENDNVFMEIFPELKENKESEDEKIRREIIKYLEQTVPHHHRDEVLKSKEWIAWLEKKAEVESDMDDIEAEEKDIRKAFNKIWDEKQGEKKPAEWSEEDKNILNGITSYLCTHDACELDGFDEWYDWLKSLKDRNLWKPSEEQIVVLELASKYERVFTPKQIDILIGLKEQLKKLKA